jgi:hypothetical protein
MDATTTQGGSITFQLARMFMQQHRGQSPLRLSGNPVKKGETET